MHIQKKEEKLKSFRQYLADKDVILAIVKCILNLLFIHPSRIDLLAVRTQAPWPGDPLEHLRDYFGRQRDPMWDVVDQLNAENATIQQELPQLEQYIVEIEEQINQAKKQNRAQACF